MAVKLPENNRHWTTNWEFRVSDKPPTTNVYAGHGDFSGTTNEPIGSTTLNTGLAALGYRGKFSSHGFRSTATTILSLLGYPDNRVDLQLAHLKRNDSSRAPYDHTKYISSRRILMQDWADIWDMFAKGSNMEDVTEAFGPLSEKRTRLLSVVEREQ